ncbi:PAS domain S-box protein [Ferribacterium limneticum]|uniref:PAS domain S-box protein n=1 Tax=Ferribacterium limneticum TaxID=76259 RepID=UPI001CFB1820|nr:PAS domain S-box protein [Ferribacterium limneticum]UCV27931.1 PAS domain S-box protein [Ferribacterium limneticum]UCV31848.1 PAS domain S-box protein [Ferribacterium limneticum]
MYRSFNYQSLKTRITLVTFGIFLLGTWSLSFYVGRVLERDMTQLLSDQQFSLARLLGKEIDQELSTRRTALELAALSSEQAMHQGPAAMQTFIEHHPFLLSMFNGGLVAIGRDGVAIAEVPLSAKRIGTNYLDRKVVVTALEQGHANIGSPVLGKTLKAPAFVMAAPIRDEHGSVIGALAGAVNLGQPNFLSEIMDSRFGKSGGFLLIDRAGRQIVMATDKRRALEKLPEPGVNPLIDRFLEGYEGSAIMVNPLGQEILASDVGLPSANWIVSVVSPTDEAFAPIVSMKRQMQIAALVLTFLAAGLTWWALRRQMKPLDMAIARLQQMSAPAQKLAPLPIEHPDEIGRLVKAFNVLVDTVDAREQALRESDERLRNILETSLDGFWRVSQEGNLLEVNERYCQLSGYTPAEMLGRSVIEFLGKQDLQLAMARHHQILATGRGLFEDTHRRKDGTTWHVEVSATYRSGGADEVVSFIRDISERKRHEAAFLEAEHKFNALVQQSLVGVYMIAAGRWLYVNPHFATMFGYASPQELIASAQVSDLVAPEDRELVANNLRRREEGALDQINYSFSARRKDGSLFSVEVYGSRIEFEGQPSIMGVALDITKRRQGESALENQRNLLEDQVLARTRELAEARDRAEAANRAKTAFLGSMSHELRTPLNHIFGFAALLGSDIETPRGKERLNKLKLSADALLTLINDLLDYSRLESNQIVIDDQNFELAALLDQIELAYREVAASKGLLLQQLTSPLLPKRLRGDPIRLAQIIGHLVDNAIKFSQHGMVSLRVSQEEGDGTQRPLLRFEVEDQGPGVLPEIQGSLFTLFQQGDNSTTRRFGGTGLGLALCKRMVRLMAGEIGFSSVPGQGSTFWLVVPLLAADSREAAPIDMEPGEAPAATLNIADLAGLLAAGDIEAKTLCDRHQADLERLLKDRTPAFREAVADYDFETAHRLMQEAIGNPAP